MFCVLVLGGVFCCCRWLVLLPGVGLVTDAVVCEFWYLVVLIWLGWVSVAWLGCLVVWLVCGLCITVVSLLFSCCFYD